MDAFQEDVGDGVEHSAGYHARTEAHGTENKPDGIEHARHSTGGYEIIDAVHAAIYLGMGIAGSHDSFKEILGGNAAFASYLYEHFRLENESTDAC